MRAAKSFGAKYYVLVADHFSGFSLYPTKAHSASSTRILGKTMREVRTKERWKGRRTPTQDPSTDLAAQSADYSIAHSPGCPSANIIADFVAACPALGSIGSPHRDQSSHTVLWSTARD